MNAPCVTPTVPGGAGVARCLAFSIVFWFVSGLSGPTPRGSEITTFPAIELRSSARNTTFGRASDERIGSLNYATIDQYARQTPEAYTRDLNTLSAYLTAPARTELAKARVVYSWIMQHVRYDDAIYTGQTYSSETRYAQGVLKSRRAVCTGFSLLFKELLKRAGVNVTNVKGYSRADDAQAGRPTGPIDHEWNAVELDGDWYLLDLAWASTTARHNASGQRQPNDFYFLTEPTHFVAQHLPADARWQLLRRPISKAEFDRFPKIYDSYFRFGFDEAFPKTGMLRAQPNMRLTFYNDQPVEFMCSYGPAGSARGQTLPVQTTRQGDQYTLTVDIPSPRNATLYVFAAQKTPSRERVKSYECILSFGLQR